MTAPAVETLETVWIPRPDGVRLAARLFRPAGAARVPAIAEIHPYRRKDFWRALDEHVGPQFAVRGYAYLRVDVRGTGDSGGVLGDEYAPDQQDDAIGVVEWLAAQSWCDGRVGLRGLSWGGFVALQAAARAPAPLRAVAVHCASDDRWRDDCHYVGGALARANFQWGLLLHCFAVMPPDPAEPGVDWRETWRTRLRSSQPLLARWLEHGRRDHYWRCGTVDPAALKLPVLATSGWLDAYLQPLVRLLAERAGPRDVVIGPWGHSDPAFAEPGPGLDWIPLECQWWDRWLRSDEQADATASLNVYVPERHAHETWPQPIAGSWRALGADALSPDAPAAELHLDAGRLTGSPGTARWHPVPANIVGTGKRDWLVFRPSAAELPGRQNADDSRSACWDGAPLAATAEWCGTPSLHARVRADAPIAQLAVRLTEVRDDGTSHLLTWGLLNLCDRTDAGAPQPLIPGEPVDVVICLQPFAHRLRAGSRLRLALSQGLWPMTWPAPVPANVEVDQSRTVLRVPEPLPPAAAPSVLSRHQQPSPAEIPAAATERAALPSFDEVLAAYAAGGPGRWVAVQLRAAHAARRMCVDECVRVRRPAGGLRIERQDDWTLEASAGDPNAGAWRGSVQFDLIGAAGRVGLRAAFELRSTADEFLLEERLVATEDGRPAFERNWTHRIPRDLI